MVALVARSRFFFALIGALALIPKIASADILFEGYSKVLLGTEHVGYTIVRYEFDPKKKEFLMTSLLRTGPTAGNINESTKARSGSALKPIAYQYTSLVSGKAKTIDATFAGDEMTATVREDGKNNVIKKKIPKGAFLSSFLAYLMLQGQEGIKPGTHYGYQAIAEEDASVSAGEAVVEKEEMLDGLSTFRVLNSFKGAKFVSNVTAKGEVVSTHSPAEQISTELVATMQEATAGSSFNANSVKTLFGSVPQGIENSISRRAAKGPVSTAGSGSSATPAANPPKGSSDASPVDAHELKKRGVPQGAGLNLKGASDQGN